MAFGDSPDRLPLFWRHPLGDELRYLPARTDNTQGTVVSSGQPCSEIDDALQYN